MHHRLCASFIPSSGHSIKYSRACHDFLPTQPHCPSPFKPRLCVHVHMGGVQAHVCVYSSRLNIGGISLICFSRDCLRQSLLLNLELSDLGRLAGQQALGICWFPPPRCHIQLLCGWFRSEIRSPAYITGTLSTTPSLQPYQMPNSDCRLN